MIDEEKKTRIWNKMPVVEGRDKEKFRLHSCGALIQWDKYGDRQSDLGWEIDHVVPKALLKDKGVPEEEIDDDENLRPMHWKNNDAKSMDYPEYQTKVTYEDGKNVEGEWVYEVNESLQKTLQNKYSKYGI